MIEIAFIGPLVAGLIALFAGKSKAANTIVQSVFALSALAGLVASIDALLRITSGTMLPVHVTLPWLVGGAFTLDGWSAFFLILVNLGVLLTSLFAIDYLPRYAKTYSVPLLNVVSALFIVGMQATVLSASVFTFLLFWEVMSVSAYFLVIADREEASIRAGFIYFVMTHLGVACLLAGFLILTRGNAAASFTDLAGYAATLPHGLLALSFFLLFAGFGSKAGLIPLHQWLPYAHPQAPSNSSALMSGVMLKVAVYGFLRVVFLAFPVIPTMWAMVIVIVGLVSAAYGVLYASIEMDLKRLLAWSSIENMGLIFAMVGTALAAQSLGKPSTFFWVAACFHALNHTIFKSGLFMASGSIISETHTRKLDEMGGLAKPWPALSMWFLGLVFAAAALPPAGTFYGEWMFLQRLALGIGNSAVLFGFLSAIAISVVAFVGGLAIFAFAKTFSAIFLSKARSSHAEHAKRLPAMLVWPIGLTVLASVALGFFAGPASELIGRLVDPTINIGLYHSIYVGADAMIQPMFVFLVAIIVGCAALLVRRFARHDIRVTDTWDCGQPITARMEYTATGFAAPIRFFFRSFVLSKKEMVTERVAPENAWILKRRLVWSTRSIWEAWIYAPITRAALFLSSKVRRLQSGVVQFYILLVFVTLIIVLVVAV